MTPLQTLQLRASEIRSRLATIGGMDDLDAETRAEADTLGSEYADNETRQRALIVSGDGPGTPLETRTGEGREFRELLGRASVGQIFNVAVNGGETTGATAELQKHYGLEKRAVPLAMLIDKLPDDLELETRATAAPTNVGQNQQSIIPYVFPDSVSVFLGLDMPTVPTGDAVFPILTTAPTVGTPAEGVAATISDGTFEAEVLLPKRYQTFFTYTREDAARFEGMDMALRDNLSAGMASELDNQAISGTGGLLTGTVLANHNVTTETSYALYRSQFAYGRVDGRFASMVDQIRVVMGASTYEHAASQYRGNNDNTDALASLMAATGGVMVSNHVPAATGTPAKQNAIIRRGMRRDFVQPVWDSVLLIPDEITGANEGTIKVTAVGLFNQKLIRADGFYKQQTQHA